MTAYGGALTGSPGRVDFHNLSALLPRGGINFSEGMSSKRSTENFPVLDRRSVTPEYI